MTQDAPPLPRWDLTPLFPSLESPEFEAAFQKLRADLDSLEDSFQALAVRRRPQPSVDAPFAGQVDQAIQGLNGVMEQMRSLSAYLGCLVTTDARNETAQARRSQLDALAVRLDQLHTRFVAWVGTSDIETLLQLSETARSHAHPLRRACEMAAHQMPEGEEMLAAALRPSSISAWARLHGDVTALLSGVVTIDDQPQTLTVTQLRALASHPNRAVRRAALDAELRAWESVEVPLAAALNGVKGFQNTLRVRRGYLDDVEPTLAANGIDREALDAMQAACVESFPDFHRLLAFKAAALRVDRLGWHDLAAPVGTASRTWTWDQAARFVSASFHRYSSRLGEFADRTFRERWHDAEPRTGKQGGAYCTPVRPGESRLFMNFDGSFTSVSTLAHELGHAYHNLNLAHRTPLQRATPSTLAETASIFCETLCFQSALESATPEQRLVLLNTSLERDLMVVVDIHSRFLFEKRVFERRSQRALTVSELKELMLQAQRATYGRDIDPLHPYMWAVKGHYYGPLFYNYPYTFGLLFGLGLYAEYCRDPGSFHDRYDDLLSSTGLADAAELGRRFGVDIRSIDFWRSSLNVIRQQIADYGTLVRSLEAAREGTFGSALPEPPA